MSSHDPQTAALTSSPARVEGCVRLPLADGWQAASCQPDSQLDPTALGELKWLAATVPGTAAAALRDAGRWRPGDPVDLDAEDWWFRTEFEAEPAQEGEEVLLCFDGIATVAEVFLNGSPLLESDSMFAAHALDVGARLRAGGNELAIRCRALGPLLRARRKPRARWRTKLVDGGLRFFRTMLLGRAPGFAPGPAAVGPWRPVRLERRRRLALDRLRLRSRLAGENGVLAVSVALRTLGGAALRACEVELSGPSGTHRGPLAVEPAGTGAECAGELVVPSVARWWPHTHCEPVLHEVRLHCETAAGALTVEAGRVGFRDLAAGPEPGHDAAEEGLDLHVNGVRVFARGAVWTLVDAAGLAADEAQLRVALEQARDAGMNMLRVPGTSAYESPAFHDLCDELGILVWQDFMFANLDYPIADDGFRAAVEAEAEALLAALGSRPSLAVLCGNSEIEQQVAMLGLDPELGRGELFGELLPRLVEAAGVDAPYLPSAPCGGELPFRPDRGVANYYGIGGYRRPLEDARRAEVRFAAECLAFANVPDEAGVEAILPEAPADVVVHHPRWKAGVPRDAGTGWDFDDVRDHYLGLLFDLDPGELRRYDHERYLELSRAVSGEAMAAVFGEWRRAGSPCGGGLVLWMRDLAPGAGWGVVDDAGAPKCAYHHLRRALAPTAVWMTDEGLGGIGVHVANDGPEPLAARLRIGLYRDFEQQVGEVDEELALDAHDAGSFDLEALLGRFADASWAYRFGPPAQDLIVASLEKPGADGGSELLSQAVQLPAGRPRAVESASRLGLELEVRVDSDGSALLALTSRRFVYGLRVTAAGMVAADDAFSLEPGRTRTVNLKVADKGAADGPVAVTALNLHGRVAVSLSQ
jgi:beta-mannosidase